MSDDACSRAGHAFGACIFILFCPILCPIVTFLRQSENKENGRQQQPTQNPPEEPQPLEPSAPPSDVVSGQSKSENPLPVYNPIYKNYIYIQIVMNRSNKN